MALETILWQCETCEGKPQFEHEAFLAHAATVHNQPRPIQGMRELAMHLDGKTRYASVYRWTFDSFTATQKVSSERAGEDRAMWEAFSSDGP